MAVSASRDDEKISVLIALFTIRPHDGVVGLVFNPYRDLHLWAAWWRYAENPESRLPQACVSHEDLPHPVPIADRPLTLVSGRIVGRVLADARTSERIADGPVVTFDPPAAEPWPALARASENDRFLSYRQLIAKWSGVETWRNAAKRPRIVSGDVHQQLRSWINGPAGCGLRKHESSAPCSWASDSKQIRM